MGKYLAMEVSFNIDLDGGLKNDLVCLEDEENLAQLKLVLVIWSSISPTKPCFSEKLDWQYKWHH